MIVRQAAYVLNMFEYFSQIRQPATLADVADHFGWPRSRYLQSSDDARGEGISLRCAREQHPTPRWLALAGIISDVEPLPEWTHALIAELSAATGETAAIAAPAGTMAVFIDVVRSNALIRYFAQNRTPDSIHTAQAAEPCCFNTQRRSATRFTAKVEFKQFGPNTPISIKIGRNRAS